MGKKDSYAISLPWTSDAFVLFCVRSSSQSRFRKQLTRNFPFKYVSYPFCFHLYLPPLTSQRFLVRASKHRLHSRTNITVYPK